MKPTTKLEQDDFYDSENKCFRASIALSPAIVCCFYVVHGNITVIISIFILLMNKKKY